MKASTSGIFSRDTGEQAIDSVLTEAETTFIKSTAFPQLDAIVEEKTLEKFTDLLWNLCLWERQRANSIDTKAAALTGLSSLAAAVVSASTVAPTTPDPVLLGARCLSIVLFIGTVILSVNAQRVVKFGGFHDGDVFDALGAHRVPVGVTPPFSDGDPHRCFLREVALQRWLIYRTHSDTNDTKYRRLAVAQGSAVVAVASLLGAVVAALW